MGKSLKLGAVGFIPKKIEISVLLSAIRLVLTGGTYIPSNLIPFLPKEEIGKFETPMEYGSLTQRQIEVLGLIQKRLSNKKIARQLNVSEATVKAYVTVILKHHGVSSRTRSLMPERD